MYISCNINKNFSGLTLIELIIVIAILGIIAIIAIPKFINLSEDAQLAVTKSIAAALTSANAENYAFRTEKNTYGSPIKNCNSAAKLLQSGLPHGYKIKSAKIAVNTSVSCTLQGPSSTTATFIATGIL